MWRWSPAEVDLAAGSGDRRSTALGLQFLGRVAQDDRLPLGPLQHDERNRRVARGDFDAVLTAKILEDAAGRSPVSAQALYQSLTLSDQAQMREHYLSKLEGVDIALRHKFKKLYQYY